MQRHTEIRALAATLGMSLLATTLMAGPRCGDDTLDHGYGE